MHSNELEGSGMDRRRLHWTRWQGLCCAGALAIAAGQPGAAPAETGTARQLFEAKDAFGLAQAADPQISPNGTRIAYVRLAGNILTDRMQSEIWIVDVRSGRQRPLGVAGSSNPRWSPDGSRLAYIADAAEGRPQLFVRWLDSGASAAVAALPEAPSDIAWSRDGHNIAFTMFVPAKDVALGDGVTAPAGVKWATPIKVINRINFQLDGLGILRPGYAHIFAVPSDGGTPRQLTTGDYDDLGPLDFTADGERIVFTSNRRLNWELDPLDTNIFSISLNNGALKQLTDRIGPDQASRLSPNGKLIAYIGFSDKKFGFQNNILSVMNVDGTGKRELTALMDRSFDNPQWAASGKSIYASYRDHGITKVMAIGLDGRTTVVASGLAGNELDRPYSGGTFSVADDGSIAFPWGDTTRPPDVGLVRNGTQKRLTELNDFLFSATLAVVRPLLVAAESGNPAIEAWVATPPGYDPKRRYPLILEVHGGPYDSYGPLWSTQVQLYAAAGYIVVYGNPRGSTSYGEAFAQAINRAYPGPDYDDLMRIVDAAIQSYPVDAHALFVTGGSGGGTLTAWIVGKTHRFRAAVAQKPVIDWTSEVLTTDGLTIMAPYWFGQMPWENSQAFWSRSPLSLVGNVKTPTALVVGDNDARTPPGQAEQFYAALQLRGVPTALIRVPDASHSGLVARPSQLIGVTNAILAWFDRYRTAPCAVPACR